MLRLCKFFSLLFLTLTIASCSFLVALDPNYDPNKPQHPEQYWISRNDQSQATFYVYRSCFQKAFLEYSKRHNITPNFYSNQWDRYEVALGHGECLSNLGFYFEIGIFDKYCYRYVNENNCKAFKKFKK